METRTADGRIAPIYAFPEMPANDTHTRSRTQSNVVGLVWAIVNNCCDALSLCLKQQNKNNAKRLPPTGGARQIV